MNEREMRAYLLGQAADVEAERLEVRLLEDEDVHAVLRSVEEDLFDDYAAGRLTEQERRQFLERYAGERPRLLVAHALAARAASSAPSVVPTRQAPAVWRWMPAAAAAAVVAAGAGMTFWMRSVPRDVPVSVAPPPVQALQSPAVLDVVLGTSRSATAVPETVLAAGTATLELRVRLNPADRFDIYSMELRSASGALVWRGEGDKIKANVSNGDLTIVGSLPASAISTGSYELAVRGSGPAPAADVLGYATVSIRR